MLSRRQAEILLRSDLANLAKKVKAGKTLTAGERNLLQSALGGGKASTAEYVDNVTELAEILGVTRQTIGNWKKIEGNPGTKADGRYHVPSWREFQRLRGHTDDAAAEDAPISVATAKARQILLQNERLEMRILRERGDLIPKVVAQQVFSKLVIAAKTRSFSSITRFVTLAKLAPDSNAAAEEIRKEMAQIWKGLEEGQWLK